jgi:hypothetical protein
MELLDAPLMVVTKTPETSPAGSRPSDSLSRAFKSSLNLGTAFVNPDKGPPFLSPPHQVSLIAKGMDDTIRLTSTTPLRSAGASKAVPEAKAETTSTVDLILNSFMMMLLGCGFKILW